MKGIIIVGCRNLVAAIEVQVALAAADLKVPVICIQQDFKDREIENHAQMIEAIKIHALEAAPDPTGYDDVFKKEKNPQFKFNNVRRIKKK